VQWLAEQFIAHPEIAIFLALGAGFALGQVGYHGLALGAVTGTLLVGVVIGAVFQTDGATIEISSVTKQVFFLLFLFALGYRLGPQFFSGLKGAGVPQAVFTLILVVVGLATVIMLSLVLGFNPGVAAGLAAGGLTQSSIIGVAQDSISNLDQDPATLQQWQDLVSVGYAVTYIFGTVGAAIYCANIAPSRSPWAGSAEPSSSRSSSASSPPTPSSERYRDALEDPVRAPPPGPTVEVHPRDEAGC